MITSRCRCAVFGAWALLLLACGGGSEPERAAAPVLQAVQPSVVAAGAAQALVLRGTGLAAATSARLEPLGGAGDRPLDLLAATEDDARGATVPATTPAATYVVRVVSPAGTSAPGPTLTVRADGPVVEAVAPAAAYNDRETTVRVTGVDLEGVTAAALLGETTVTLPPPTVLGAKEVLVSVPVGTAPGRYQVRLTAQAGTALSAPDALAVRNLADPNRPGAFAVGVVEESMAGASGDTVAVRIAYPARAAGPAAEPDPELAPYPAVVLLHAFKPPILAGGIDYRGYTDLSDHLASFGYVVICPDLAPNNDLLGAPAENAQRDADDARAAIDHLAARSANPTDVFAGLVDPMRCAAVGHSRGGDGALIACADEAAAGMARLLAVATLGAPAFDPSSGARLPLGDFTSIPALSIGASEDRIVAFTDAQDLFVRSGSPADAFELVGGNHAQYTDSGDALPFDGTPTISVATQHAIVRRYVTAFFGTHVGGRTAIFAPFLQDGEAIAADGRIRHHLWK